MIAIPTRLGNADHYTSTMTDSNCPPVDGDIEITCYVGTPAGQLKEVKPAPWLAPPPAAPTWPSPRPVCRATTRKARPPVVRKQPRMRAEVRKVESRIQIQKED